MQIINKLAAYGQALSRKQIAAGLGLTALISVAGLVMADYLTAPTGDAVSDTVGAIQAEFKVNESGAATYSIKIYTPPGTAGVAPQVALGYSSQGGNGVMGKGWSITGTSGISRCRASREAGDFISGGVPVDGDAGPVNFSNSDKFCLDGQRLLEVSNSTDSCKVVSGAAVKSLRTEIETFQRVCAYTFVEANGPRFFTVERKDGSTSWYGDRDTNSTAVVGSRTDGFLESNRQLSDGTYTNNATISTWLQTRFQDSTGNYIDYLYLKNPTQGTSTNVTGELVLSEIKYTGKIVLPGQSGSASAPYASVKFNYGLANEVVVGYQSGSRFTQSQRLNSVTVTNDDVVVRHYPLTYMTSVSGSGAILLSQVKECADVAAVTCMQPTVFNWGVGVNGFATEEHKNLDLWNVYHDTTSGPMFGGALIDMKWGDVDGDGSQDIVPIYKDSNDNITSLRTKRTTSNSSGIYFTPFLYNATLPVNDSSVPAYYTENGPGGEGWFLVDYNGDGSEDLALSTGTTTGKWVIRPSYGPNSGNLGFSSSVDLLAGLTNPIPSNQKKEFQPKLSDLNGDGLVDILYYKDTPSPSIKARLMEKQNGVYGWYTERNVVAQDICAGINNCSYKFDGLFRKRGHQQLYDFNGDSRSDLILYAKVTAARSTTLFNSQGDISTPPTSGGTSFQGTKRVSFALTVDSITPTEIKLKRYSWWDSSTSGLDNWINFADINGDGMPDLVQNNDNIVRYQINNGMGFRPSKTMSGSIIYNSKLQVLDVNGDGRADLVYPDYYVSRFKTRLADINGDFNVETEIAGGNAKTNCNPNSSAISECLGSHIYTFTDLDGDGNLDFLRMRIKSTNGLEGNDAQTYVSRASTESQNTPRDTITEIQDGLGAKIQVGYLPLTNKDTYRRGKNCRTDCVWGRASPVQDFMAPMYVVTSVAISAPTQADPSAMKSTYYRYAGARLQAGGRGLVGFNEITSFDASFPGFTLATQQKYFQGYPAVGTLAESSTRILPGNAYNPKACLNTANTYCYAYGGELFPALGGTLISKTVYAWDIYPAFNPGQQVPIQLRPYSVDSETYDPISGARTTRVAKTILTDVWGNDVQTVTDTYSGAENTNPITVTTNNTYQNDTVNWRLSRMISSAVAHGRNGQWVVRNTSFDYDMTGPTTGFLKTERISPNGPASQDMRKEYSLDAYGNRIASFSCSQGIANCKSTTLDYSPWDITKVHRYSRVEYDSRGRYVTGTFEPFNTPGQQWDSTVLTERKTQTVLARDKYGEITHAKDVNGVSVVSQRSAMGRDYWSWVQTTPNATPGDPSQGIDSYKTYRYCGAATNQVLCPTAAKFREQIVTDASPKRWSYFDALKRPVMEITQTFNEGVTGKDFSAVCKSYDVTVRPSFVSDTFFLSEAQYNGEPSFGAADPCANRKGTKTTYDVLGRPTSIVMSDNSETTTDYAGLTTVIANALGQTKTEEKNALGELVKTTDHLDHQTHYAYDAAGNLATVKRNAGRGDIVTSMSYDSLGRKSYMKDPDAGEWWYNYYPSGELASQGNNSEMIYRESRYDYRGRLVWSGTQHQTGTWESVNVSSYDTAANGVGQVNCNWEDGFQYLAWQGDTSKNNNWTKCQQYDSMGRATTTTTTIDGSAYYEVARYDNLSRPYKRMDPTGKWIKTEFTPRGMGVRTCESSDADTDPTCARNVATTYVETLETNARGNVVKEQRGGTSAMQVTRTYNELTGALLRTCSGNNCQIADEKLDWDTVGNLRSRDIANEYREEYSYDDLNRLSESRFSRIASTNYSIGSQPISSQQTYDALGNICSKTINGVLHGYNYAGASGCGLNGSMGGGNANPAASPHAVQSITDGNVNNNVAFSYDTHGNQTYADRTDITNDRLIDYTANDQAYQVIQGRNTTQFWYTPGNQRYKRVDIFYDTVDQTQNSTTTTTTVFAVSKQKPLFGESVMSGNTVKAAGGGLVPFVTKTINVANLEIITAPNGVVTTRRTVAGVMLQETVNNFSVNRYLFHNHLGSVIRIAEADGSVLESFDFAPFGERRNPIVSNPNGTGYASSLTKRGYTGHEMIDSFGIIHMNGRIYDSALGRFLQADPMVEDPSNGQNFNRYTYVWNNPLAYTDPSGFISFKQLIRQVAAVFIASYLPGANFWGAAANGALANISAGFIGGVVSTGNLKGGLAGAFSSGVMYAGRPGEVEEAVVPVRGNDSNVDAENTRVYGATLTPSTSYFADCKAKAASKASGAASAPSDKNKNVSNALQTMVTARLIEIDRLNNDDLETLEAFRWRIRDAIMKLTNETGYEYVGAFSIKHANGYFSYSASIQTAQSAVVSGTRGSTPGAGWTYEKNWDMHSHGKFIDGYRLNELDVLYLSERKIEGASLGGKGGGDWIIRNFHSDVDEEIGESYLATTSGIKHGYTNNGCDWRVETLTRPKK